MNFEYRSTRQCQVCGKNFFGIDATCTPCEGIVRSWAAKGFLDLCHYLEKVDAFERFCAQKESSDDPAPAADE